MLAPEEFQAKRVASLDDNELYTVATSDFVAAQAKKVAGDALLVEYKSMLMRDVLIDYIKEHGLQIESLEIESLEAESD